MESLWKIILIIVLIFAIAATGVGITMGNMDVVAANDYFDEAAQVIVESNYDEKVIERCISEAAANEYTLSVSVVGENRPGTRKYAEAILEYKYEIPLFGISDVKTKRRIL